MSAFIANIANMDRCVGSRATYFKKTIFEEEDIFSRRANINSSKKYEEHKHIIQAKSNTVAAAKNRRDSQ